MTDARREDSPSRETPRRRPAAAQPAQTPPPPRRPTATRRIPAIDGLRTFAAIAIIFGHIGSHPMNQLSPRLLAYGGAIIFPAVSVFFFTSGFLIYRPFAESHRRPPGTKEVRADGQPARKLSAGAYFLRRTTRIYPLYWTVFTVHLLLFGSGGLSGPIEWFQAWFLIPIPDTSVLTKGMGIVTWTLMIELPFYLVVPLFSKGVMALIKALADRWKPVQVELGIVFTLTAVAVAVQLLTSLPGLLAVPLLGGIGMTSAYLEPGLRRRLSTIAQPWPAWLIMVVATWLLTASVALQHGVKMQTAFTFGELISNLAIALMLFIPCTFGGQRSSLSRFLGAAFFLWAGPLTYGMYLWHPTVLEWIAPRLGPGLLWIGIPVLVLSIGLAVLSKYLVEDPVRRLRRRYLAG